MLKKMVCIVVAIMTILGPICLGKKDVSADGCVDVKIIFARGSGAKREDNEDYQVFKNALEDKLKLTTISYDFEDLDYPAVGIGVDNMWVAVGAYFGAGDAYEFGKSVDKGVQKLKQEINNGCVNTKYVIAGYSQGAMVASKALPSLNADKIIYVATFGDPKIYLPEGKGMVPPACSGKDLSNYRAYVPDCYAYEGLLGSYRPYQPEAYYDKLGVWCNKYDIFCSSYYSVDSHVSYISDDLYEDASKMIFAKITAALGVENNYVSWHDTAILIDSTGSMVGLIDKYKDEALRLAQKTLESGGRVALFDYRDLNDPYQPVEHCNFETCTLEVFKSELNKINTHGGGDDPESLLSASFTTMNKLEWKIGSTKSLVVLTDAGFHAPDIDGTTFGDVVKLSKSIDPVIFYIITTSEEASSYAELAEATGGMVTTTVDDLSFLTDTIMARYDSLPRVEESDEVAEDLPEIIVNKINDSFGDEITVEFTNSGNKVLVILNDSVLGITSDSFVTISGLNRNINNYLRLVPMTETRRGDATNVIFGNIMIPKTPDTGKM